MRLIDDIADVVLSKMDFFYGSNSEDHRLHESDRTSRCVTGSSGRKEDLAHVIIIEKFREMSLQDGLTCNCSHKL